MENLLEYKKLVRLENKIRMQLAEAPDNEKEELEAQIQDIVELKAQLEESSDTVQQYIQEQNVGSEEQQFVQEQNVSSDDIEYSAASTPQMEDTEQIKQQTPIRKQTTSSKQVKTKSQNEKSDSNTLSSLLCFLLVAGLIFGALGVYNSNQKEKKAKEEKAAQLAAQQAFYNSPEQVEKRKQAAIIAKAEARKSDSIRWERRKKLLEHSIKITSLKLSSPNSADGCDVYMAFTNKSDKTIKYLRFECHMINAVGDIVECEIRRQSFFGCKYTGPLKPGKNSGSRYWDCIIYNSSARKVILDKIEITYMDDSRLVIKSNELKYVK